MTALLIVELAPYLVLFLGRVLVAPDPATGLADEIGNVPRFLLQGVLTAGLFGGLASLIAAWTPRRAYATAAIIALLIIPPIITSILGTLATVDLARLAVLLSPADILAGNECGDLRVAPDMSPLPSRSPGWPVVAAAAVGMWPVGLTIRRYLRISALRRRRRRPRTGLPPPAATTAPPAATVRPRHRGPGARGHHARAGGNVAVNDIRSPWVPA
jgi:ABC-2 type transport system permease protein